MEKKTLKLTRTCFAHLAQQQTLSSIRDKTKCSFFILLYNYTFQFTLRVFSNTQLQLCLYLLYFL